MLDRPSAMSDRALRSEKRVKETGRGAGFRLRHQDIPYGCVA